MEGLSQCQYYGFTVRLIQKLFTLGFLVQWQQSLQKYALRGSSELAVLLNGIVYVYKIIEHKV